MNVVELRRRLYLGLHSLRHGNRFSVHGTEVVLPPEAGTELRYQIMRGRYENDEANEVRRHVPRGAHVIELGGSLGVISKIIRETIGPEPHHIVVEANPQLIPICTANASPTSGGRTQVVHAAVAYGTDMVAFQFGHNANVGRVADEGESGVVRVKTTSLSALADMLPADAPFFLVCDIEGAELSMFENERAVFARMLGAIMEIHPDFFARSGKTRDDFLSLAARSGLTVAEDLGQVLVLLGPARR